MKRFFFSVVVFFALIEPSISAEDEIVLPLEGDNTLSAGFGFYFQNDQPEHTGGNPKLDEDEFVFEGIIMLDKSLSERDRLNVRVLGDIVSSASQMRYHNPQFRALQANPSGNKHLAADVGYIHNFEALNFGSHAGFGFEANEFYSWLYGLNVAVPLMDNNTTLSVRFDGFTDYFHIKSFDGTMPGYSMRQTFTPEINLLQVLSPLDLVNFNLSYTVQFGMLETTYYSVFVADIEHSEKMPAERHRSSIAGRWKHSLSSENTIEVGYRFYLDTWKLYSHTAELRFFQYLYFKQLLLEPSVRFYTQTGAEFFQREFDILPLYRSSDSDLGPFTGALFGLRLALIEMPFFPVGINELSIGAHYWLRNDGMMIYWFDLGYLFRF